MDTRRKKGKQPASSSTSDSSSIADSTSTSRTASASAPYDYIDHDPDRDIYDCIPKDDSFEVIYELAKAGNEAELREFLYDHCIDVRRGFHTPVTKLMAEGYDYQLFEKLGASPFMIARGVGMQGNIAEAARHLKEGAEIKEILIGAALANQKRLIQYLLDNGASIYPAIQYLTYAKHEQTCDEIANQHKDSSARGKKIIKLARLHGALHAGDEDLANEILQNLTVKDENKFDFYLTCAEGFGLNLQEKKYQNLLNEGNFTSAESEKLCEHYIAGLICCGEIDLIINPTGAYFNGKELAVRKLSEYGYVHQIKNIGKHLVGLCPHDQIEGLAAGYHVPMMEKTLRTFDGERSWRGPNFKTRLIRLAVETLFNSETLSFEKPLTIMRFLSQIQDERTRKSLGENILRYQLQQLKENQQNDRITTQQTKHQMKMILKEAKEIHTLMQQGFRFLHARALQKNPALENFLITFDKLDQNVSKSEIEHVTPARGFFGKRKVVREIKTSPYPTLPNEIFFEMAKVNAPNSDLSTKDIEEIYERLQYNRFKTVITFNLNKSTQELDQHMREIGKRMNRNLSSALKQVGLFSKGSRTRTQAEAVLRLCKNSRTPEELLEILQDQDHRSDFYKRYLKGTCERLESSLQQREQAEKLLEDCKGATSLSELTQMISNLKGTDLFDKYLERNYEAIAPYFK